MATIDLSRLNDSQRDVVLRLDEPLFVAAGAGSGKTFTLTARLVYALSKGSAADGGRYLNSIDEALVITFTKAAALEIKDRVRGELRKAGEEDPHLREESLRVDGAWISTIHGMCSRILKRHGVELGIDASFEVCEGSVGEALLARALDEVLTVAQEEGAYDGLFAEFPLWGQGESATSVVGMIRLLRQEAAKCSHGYDDLVCPRSAETASEMARLRQCLEALAGLKLTQKQQEVVFASLDALDGFYRLPPMERTPERACEVLGAVKMPRLQRKDAKPLMDDAREAHAAATVCAHFERVQEYAPQLVSLARRVDDCYARLKHEHSYVDNDDLIEFALRAVQTNAQVARDYAGRFKLVMIDEFQDTDQKQLQLISLLSGRDARHLTTVGDAQQSIYRFRGGDVEVFRARGRGLPQEHHVQMDVNYRSDHHVLAVVERVCGDAGVLDDFLKLAGNAGRKSRYVARTASGEEPPRVFLEVAKGGPSSLTSATLAAQLADRLAQLAHAGQPVSSMALLLGTTSKVELYLDALRARGLQAVVTGGSSFTSTTEVGVIQALLHTFANPHDTENGLFRVLSSDMFHLDADDFCMLGTREQDVLDAPTKRQVEQCFVSGNLELYGGTKPSRRLALAHDVLTRAFARLGRWELADVCQAAIEESGWLARLEREGTDGLAVAANVLAAVRYVRELTTSLGLGVARAAEEFDKWLSVAKLTPKGLAGDTIEAVQVMTIHGSKGLQFGVTAVAECWGKPKVGGRLAVGPAEGRRVVCVVPKPDLASFSKMRDQLETPRDARSCSSVAEWAAWLKDAELREQAAEKARLLYVALTRAEEALVVGIPIAEKEWYKSELALGMLGAFPELDEPVAGECEVSIEPELGISCEAREDDGMGGTRIVRRRMPVSPALARVVELRRGAEKGDPWQAVSAGTLAGFDGELPEAVSLVPLLGTVRSGQDQGEGLRALGETFELFDVRRRALAVYGWRERQGIYSYSSLRAAQVAEERAQKGLAAELPPEAQRDADAEGGAYFDDADKATSLGSAFHELAQTMVESGSDKHDPARLEALAQTWCLSERQVVRLRAAIARWESSDLLRETHRYALRRAEVPFFVHVPESPLGDYFEGAIDLLCTEGAACAGRVLVVDYKTGDLDLTEEEVAQRHELQARLYAETLLAQGFAEVSCAFICVETGIVARWNY
ncbi:MAG: UvrD-helicase domain-containing protein [Atopobiaceae bacterium]|nr:UvrD-helicase domain-containing protein [Atopobiaceae bacterium]